MSQRRLVIVGLLLGIIGIIIFYVADFQLWSIPFILIGLLFIFGIMIAIADPTGKLEKILTKDYDPERFIFEYDKFFGLNGKSKIAPVHALNRVRGFFAMGNLEETKNILDQINIDKIKTPMPKALYYLYLATYYLGIDNIEEAKKCLANFYDVPLGGGQKIPFDYALEAVIFEIKYKEGYLKEGAKIRNKLLEEVEDEWQRMDYVFHFALKDIDEGRTDDAKQALEMVVNESDESPILTLAKQELKKLTLWEILNEDCDPEKFIFEYDKFYGLDDGKNRLTPPHLINRFVGLSDMGNFEEAKNMLDKINIDKIKTSPQQASYYLNLAVYYLDTDNVEEAKKYLPRFYDVPLDEKQTRQLERMLNSIIAVIKLKEGGLEESREIFNRLLKTAKTKRVYLVIIFDLALVDIAEGKIGDAEQALEKVINEGNKLHIVTLAKQELEKIKTQGRPQ